ncbi:MAG TPA: CPBP family glutamic-type intramembrane protease [Candidatus Paceibacterota bacterium]|nr:CPBP family glutamic-type intramembrane protease [Candidatus Paceibacterota bacterium]
MDKARTLVRRMFRRWLRYEPTWNEFIAALPGITALMFMLSLSGYVLAKLLVPIGNEGGEAINEFLSRTPFLVVMAVMVLVVLVEEAVFRLPLLIPLHFAGPGKVTAASVIVLSVVFGELHGSWHFMVQGLSGIVLSLVFLKCGGVRGRWGYLKGYACAAVVHYSFNAAAIISFFVKRWFGFASGL